MLSVFLSFFSFLISSTRARNMPTKCVYSTCSTQKMVVLLLKDWDQTIRYVPAHRVWENEIVFYCHNCSRECLLTFSAESHRSYWMSLLTWIWTQFLAAPVLNLLSCQDCLYSVFVCFIGNPSTLSESQSIEITGEAQGMVDVNWGRRYKDLPVILFVQRI